MVGHGWSLWDNTHWFGLYRDVVLEWHSSYGSVRGVADTSLDYNHGNVSGATHYASNTNGWWVLDGVNDELTSRSQTVLNGSDAITVLMWARVDSYTAYNALVTSDGTNQASTHGMGLIGGSQWQWYVRYNGPNSGKYVQDQWCFFGGVYSRTGNVGHIKQYWSTNYGASIAQKGQTNDFLVPAPVPVCRAWRWGCQAGIRYLDGEVDNLTMLDRRLTDAEIADWVNKTKGVHQP